MAGCLATLGPRDGQARAPRLNQWIGSSWEGFVIEQVLATQRHDDAWFWSVHQGPEIDLVLRRGDRLLGIEVKRTDAPSSTASLTTAIGDLELDRAVIIYPGHRRYALSDRVEVVPVTALARRDELFP